MSFIGEVFSLARETRRRFQSSQTPYLPDNVAKDIRSICEELDKGYVYSTSALYDYVKNTPEEKRASALGLVEDAMRHWNASLTARKEILWTVVEAAHRDKKDRDSKPFGVSETAEEKYGLLTDFENLGSPGASIDHVM